MRNKTLKRAKLDRVADKWRKGQIKAVGRCEVCLRPDKPNRLTIHEIARGQHRMNAQDKAFATLVLHPKKCHQAAHSVSLAGQLALLKRARPQDFNMELYWALIARRFPYAEDIQAEFEKLSASLDNPTAVQPETKPRQAVFNKG